jgi:leucyl-tRNA synthetase
MGPLEATKPWSTQNIEGPRRFLERVYRLYKEVYKPAKENKNLEKIYHQTVKKVTEDYENLRFNTAISQMMIFINECYKDPNIPNEYMEGFLKLLAPVCPHITEELNETVLKSNVLLTNQKWPTYDEAKTVENLVTYVFQVNGKIRDKAEVSVDTTKEEIESLALASENIQKYIDGKPIRRIIVVSGKLVNIVV